MNKANVRVARGIFQDCHNDLVNNVDLNVLYPELSRQCTKAGLQVTKVFILRGGVTPTVEDAKRMFKSVSEETNEDFVKWITAIEKALFNTSNQASHHGEIADKMAQIRLNLSGEKKSEPRSKWMGASAKHQYSQLSNSESYCASSYNETEKSYACREPLIPQLSSSVSFFSIHASY